VKMRQANRRFSVSAGQGGFSILEMLLASVIMMVGIISVVQLVPASLQLNANNRLDTMATVIAQRELDQMLAHLAPCPAPTPCPPNNGLLTPNFTDEDRNFVNLGDLSQPGIVVGGPVVMVGPTAVVDFSVAASAIPVGYIIQGYQDPNDPNFPNGATFELRWAVITQLSTNRRLVSKRIIIGCRQTNATRPMLPVNLDTSVHK